MSFGSKVVQVRLIKMQLSRAQWSGDLTERTFLMQVLPESSWKSFADYAAEDSSDALTSMAKFAAAKGKNFVDLLEGQAFTRSTSIKRVSRHLLSSRKLRNGLSKWSTLGGLFGTE